MITRATVGFEIDWKKSQTDLRLCYTCKDMIFSDMFTMIVRITSKKTTDKIIEEVTVCNSCKEFIK